MPRLIPLRAPKDFNFWRRSWKTSKRESEQPSGLSRMKKTHSQLKAGSRGPDHLAEDRAYRVECLESADSIR
jgi:hypothetical protein